MDMAVVLPAILEHNISIYVIIFKGSYSLAIITSCNMPVISTLGEQRRVQVTHNKYR